MKDQKMGHAFTPEILRTALSKPLPGHEAFSALSGYPRNAPEQARELSPPPKESAVLAVFHTYHGEDHLLLMRRTEYPGVHSGQIAFPGGKREPKDADLQATALREFGEETGADLSHVEVLGRLSPIYIPPSRTVVSPYVGWVDQLGPFRPDPREVAALLHVPLRVVLDPASLQRKLIRMATGQQAMVAYWHLNGETVWGATAMMIAELRAVLGEPLPRKW